MDIVESPYFKTVLYQLNEANGRQIDLDTGGRRFIILTCIEGQATVEVETEQVDIQMGQTALIPACQGRYILSGIARVLRSFQPTATP